MAPQNQLLHFIMLPHLAHGHMIPMIDMARLLAQRGLVVTLITTPLNAARFKAIIHRARDSGLQIQLLHVPFPFLDAGLPQGCESMDSLPSRDMVKNLIHGIGLLQTPIEQLLDQLQPHPSCIISDKNLPWTHYTAEKFGIPRLVFDGTSCFSLLCTHNIVATKVHERVSQFEPFVVPYLPDRIEITKAQLPNAVNVGSSDMGGGIRSEIRDKELAAFGVVVNTFEELEPAYIEQFRKARGGKVWCIGPVSLCNKEDIDKAERGSKASIDENQCLKWLDSQETGSVIYACLGSLARLSVPQLIELGLGLEQSNRPFIWVIRAGSKSEELDKWILEESFEDRIIGRGLLIRGWAPQVLFLAHPAIAGFLTHCGWNSTLEGVCAGVPMITWPMFAEQFYNEKFIVQVVKIGVSLGCVLPVKWGEEENVGVWVKREMVKRAIEELMHEGEEGKQRRRRAKVLGEIARGAIEQGGSSYLNLTLLIQEIMQQVASR
ncbi:UDPGT domain-containing protein [Cephalotus follicularis]|uniref:UDPGT domain-containing protein n=1 Tax=Cephalotus follicularis TaxID=3775 RepID=A0A1Q3BDA8_CEPFO|nr:UDPGT domain-containing protein [Cephalotus follicularis]